MCTNLKGNTLLSVIVHLLSFVFFRIAWHREIMVDRIQTETSGDLPILTCKNVLLFNLNVINCFCGQSKYRHIRYFIYFIKFLPFNGYTTVAGELWMHDDCTCSALLMLVERVKRVIDVVGTLHDVRERW